MAKNKARPRTSKETTDSVQNSDQPGALLRVQDLMTPSPRFCDVGDSANEAARVMWECDCGAVPVVQDGRVVGIVTDRDICMAAYFQGVPLASIPLASIMTSDVCTCRPGDDLGAAERLMRDRQVNRLPVVDGEALVGMLALCDLTQGVRRAGALRQRSTEGQELLETVAAIREPRNSRNAFPAPAAEEM
jgi:CBS domain-containing protein